MPQLRLEFVAGGASADTTVVDRFPFVLGRDTGCNLQVPHPFISRRHCCFFVHAGRVWLQDLMSRNGTYLNGQKLQRPEPLQDGDTLGVASAAFRIRLEKDSRKTFRSRRRERELLHAGP